MNNEQFRRLVGSNTSASSISASGDGASKPKSLLGARPKSATTTQRRSYGADFFKKQSQADGSSNDLKKQRTNVPKGTKLAAGYVDRTKLEREDEEGDEVAQKLKELEEKFKGDEITREEFERQRETITAGDISKTHLVKGLDRTLLARVRAGEDVLSDKSKANGDRDKGNPENEDDAFAELESHEVVAETKERQSKQGEKAKSVPSAVTGQKRSRDQILAEMKAAREAAKAAARPQLGSGFKKIRKDDGPRIEVDEQGREVLITVDADGNVKRKVRKVKAVDEQIETEPKKLTKTKEVKPLGADVIVPAFEPEAAEESDEDIFAGAGHDFNPLADLEDDESENEAGRDDHAAEAKVPAKSRHDDTNSQAGSEEGETVEEKKDTVPVPSESVARKNYFDDESTSILGSIRNDFDATKIAALAKSQRAENVETAAKNTETPEEEARRKRREAMLDSRDRDLEDMDMGFGGSRDDDATEMDMDGTKVQFSKWKGMNVEGSDEEGGKGGGSKRKRGPKKKKGDKNSAADVMGAMERQRKG